MLGDARRRARKLRRAVFTAQFSGWSLASFAVVSLAIALFGSVDSLVMGVALGLLAANELRGAARLRRFDEAGARILGVNQLLLAGLLAVYAGWQIYEATTHPGVSGLITRGDASAGREVDEMLAGMDAGFAETAELARFIIYGAVGVFGVVIPGLTAVYYFTRAGVVRRFKGQTPAWVVDAINAAQ